MRKFALLDMDGTLLAKRSVDILADALGKMSELKAINERSSNMPAYAVSEEVAELFAGTSRETMLRIFRSIPLNPGVRDFIRFLKGHGYKTVIVTDSYDFLAKDLASRIGIDATCGNVAIFNGNRFSGKILKGLPRADKNDCKKHSLCKLRVLRDFKRGRNGTVLSVGDNRGDVCMVAEADIGVAYRPKSEELREVATLTVSSFKELKRALTVMWRQR